MCTVHILEAALPGCVDFFIFLSNDKQHRRECWKELHLFVRLLELIAAQPTERCWLGPSKKHNGKNKSGENRRDREEEGGSIELNKSIDFGEECYYTRIELNLEVEDEEKDVVRLRKKLRQNP